MNVHFRSVLTTLAVIIPAVTVQAIKWEQNFSAALQQSRQAEKPVLVIFSNPSHDAKSDDFEKKIISTFEFKEYAAKNLVTVKFDMGKAMRKNEQAQVKKLLGDYGVKSYPAAVLIDSNNKKLGALRIDDDPEEFLVMVKSIASRYQPAGENDQEQESGSISSESQNTESSVQYPSRTWTSTAGKKVDGTLVSYDNDSVVIMNAKGMKCTVPRPKLSKEDNQYIDGLTVAAK